MTHAQRLDEIMARDEVVGHAKFVDAHGMGFLIETADDGYTAWWIEDNGRTYNPSPALEHGTAAEAARLVNGLSCRFVGARLTVSQRRPLVEIIGY